LKLLFPFAKRFIAGESLDQASQQIQRLHDKGFKVTVNLVGEQSESTEEVLSAQKEYLRILDLFQTDKLGLSIKPSSLGLSLSLDKALSSLEPITAKAFESGQTIRLDMENSATTDSTIKLCQLLNQEYPNVMGITMQSNLYRTIDDLQTLKSQDISVRLVKGAYRENKKIAFMTTNEIKDNFLLLANDLRSYESPDDAIATHDENILDLLISTDDYNDTQFEFLFGVRRDLQIKLLRDKRVGVYLPYGKNWLSYAIRRLSEWKNIEFIAKNIIKEKL